MLIEVYVDGSARGQGTRGSATGEAAAACAIYKNKHLLSQYVRGLGRRTNNEAEYEAVLLAILLCWGMDLPDPIIYSDSTVVTKQVNGEWICKSPELMPLLFSVKQLADVYTFRVVLQPRKLVWEADALCSLYLDEYRLARAGWRGSVEVDPVRLPPPPGGPYEQS